MNPTSRNNGNAVPWGGTRRIRNRLCRRTIKRPEQSKDSSCVALMQVCVFAHSIRHFGMVGLETDHASLTA
jgi:hypothetical protein